jgi:hypothetical protein
LGWCAFGFGFGFGLGLGFAPSLTGAAARASLWRADVVATER